MIKKIIQGSENVDNGENQGTEEGGSDGEDTGSGDVSQPEQPSNPDEGEENSSRTRISENSTDKLFEIKVFDNKMNLVGTATLNENVTDYSDFEGKLQEIKMYESYYVSVWAKDRTKLKISGEITKTENVTESDYSDGISSEDQMLNVRFENTEEGLKAIYNAAPVISMKSSTTPQAQPQSTNDSITALTSFSHYLGETYKLTENMQVTDDKDTNISVDDIKTTYVRKEVSSGNANSPELSEASRATTENEQGTSGGTSDNNQTTESANNSVPTEVGTYIVTYTVTDSWEREAKVTRELTINNGIERHQISFRGHIGNSDVTAFTLSFRDKGDSQNAKIVVNGEDRVVSNRYDINNPLRNFYTIKVLNENNEIRKTVVISTNTNTHTDSGLRELSEMDIPYGYKLKIEAFQPPGVSITGEILGDIKENYSDGVDNKMNLDYVTFKVTKSGLDVAFNDTDLNDNVKNVITNIDYGGLQAFK